MKKKIFVLTALLAMNCLFTFGQSTFNYTVKGELENNETDGKMVYISQFDDNKVIDSTLVADKKFIFKGKGTTPSYCYIRIGKESTKFILENGDISVSFKEKPLPAGSAMNDTLALWLTEEYNLFSTLKAKNEELRKQYTDPQELATQWSNFINPIQEKFQASGAQKFKSHNNDALGEYLLRSIAYMPNAPEAVEKQLEELGPWLKSRSYVQKMIKQFSAHKSTAEGKPFVNFKGKDLDGKEISLSDIVGKGKYVLMDMWASWCGPCKREIPNLITLQDKYKDKGFTVLGIFVWDKEPNLKTSVEKEKMTWPQIFDSENVATELYGVQGIPNITLFAPDGTILKRGLRGEKMIKAIDEIMKDK